MTRSDGIGLLRTRVNRLIREEGLRPLSARTGIPIGQLRSVSSGRAVRSANLEAICAELGFEFYVGPPRSRPPAPGSRASEGALDLSPDHLRDMETGARALVRLVVRAGGDPFPPGGRTPEPGSRDEGRDLPDGGWVEVRRLAASAGGAVVLAESVDGYLAFRRDWLASHGMTPASCAVIGGMDASMAPTLPEGCSILVDHARRTRRPDHIYAVRTSDGPVVKRARRAGRGGWIMASDNPEHPSAPWPPDAEIIGEVRWVATLIR